MWRLEGGFSEHGSAIGTLLNLAVEVVKFLIASASLKIQMSKRVLGTGKAELTARVIRFGPNSTRGRLKFGRMLVCLRAGPELLGTVA